MTITSRARQGNEFSTSLNPRPPLTCTTASKLGKIVNADKKLVSSLRSHMHQNASVDFADFAKCVDDYERQFKQVRESNKEILEACGRCLGNMTVVQALLRPLLPGES